MEWTGAQEEPAHLWCLLPQFPAQSMVGMHPASRLCAATAVRAAFLQLLEEAGAVQETPASTDRIQRAASTHAAEESQPRAPWLLGSRAQQHLCQRTIIGIALKLWLYLGLRSSSLLLTIIRFTTPLPAASTSPLHPPDPLSFLWVPRQGENPFPFGKLSILP